jgi:hypothetical protein
MMYRLKWAGLVVRKDNYRTSKRMFDTRPEGERAIGRPKRRWVEIVEQGVEENIWTEER